MPSTAEQHLNFCDAIAFGRWFLANPDLPQRIKVRCGQNFGSEVQICVFFCVFGARLCHCFCFFLVEVGAPVNHYKRATFYTHEAQILGLLELLFAFVVCIEPVETLVGNIPCLTGRWLH